MSRTTNPLTKSMALVLEELINGPIAANTLIKRLSGMIAERTIRDAIKRLRDKGWCHRTYNLEDMRRPLYFADKDETRNIIRRYRDTWKKNALSARRSQ